MNYKLTIIFPLLLIGFATSKPCSKLANDAYNINFRDNEIFEKSLLDFFDQDDQAVSLTPQSNDFQIVEYIEQINNIPPPEIETIHGGTARTLNGKWENQFALLEKKGLIWYLHFTDKQPLNRLPEFTHTLQITDDPEVNCFDLAFFERDILIDCQNQNSDLFYEFHVGKQEVELQDTKPKEQAGVIKRILESQDNAQARGCLYDTLSNQDSIIQVRVVDLHYTYLELINSDLVGRLLNQPLYKLQIVSFKLLSALPFISILDKAGNFIILKYLNQQWSIHYQDQLGFVDAIGFDYKAGDDLYKPQEYLIVGKTKVTVIRLIDEKKYTNTLSLSFDSVSRIWISKDNNYMIYGPNKLYQLVFEGSLLKLKSQQPIQGLWLIPDPTSNQFSTLTYLYTINKQRFLRSNGKNEGVYNLIHNTEPVCTVKLTLTKLGDFKISIRQPGIETIKNTLFGGTELQDYYENYDGAAITYTQIVTDRRLQLNFIKYNDINVEMDQQLTTCIFKQILSIPNVEKTFYQVQQLSDLRVLISKCVYSEQSKEGKCTFRTEYQWTLKLTSANSYFYIQSNVVRGVIIKSNTEILDFIDADNKQYLNPYRINNVKALSVSLNYVYAVTDSLIHIYSIAPTELRFQFTTDFGLENIKNIITSRSHNKIIVQDENKLWVGQVEVTTYYFTYVFEYNPVNHVSVLLFQNIFIIITVDATNNIIIQQFNFQDLYNVKSQFIVPTYDYKIEGEIQVATDLNSNYYLVAKETSKTLYNILNFRTSGVSSSTLYSVITTTVPTLVAACDQILYFQTGQIDHYITIPQQMKVETIFQYKQSEYFENYQVEVYAQTNDVQKIKIIESFNMVETQEAIYLDVMNININTKDFNKADKCTDLGTKFYQGEVTHFTVSCENCKDGTLEIQNRVQYSETLETLKSPIVQAVQLDQDYIAILSQYQIVVIKKGFTFTSDLIPLGCIGTQILPNKDGSEFYIICDKGTNQYLLIYVHQGMRVSARNQITLPLNIKVKGLTELDQFIYLVFEDRILVYLSANNQAELKSTIMTQTVGVSYAQAIAVTTKINQLYLTQGQTIKVVEFQNVNNVLTEIQRFSIDLNELLKTNKKYIQHDTQFIKSPIYKIVKDAYVRIKLVLISTNTAHYGLQLSYNCDVTKCTQAKATEISYMINQYFDWRVKNAQINNNYLGVVYQSNGKFIQAIYKLPETLSGMPETMIGAISSISQVSAPLVYDNVQYLLIAEDQKMIQLHSIKDSPKLCVLSNLEKQYVTISGHNDKDTSSTKFILQVEHSNTDDNTSGGSLIWLWVLLSLAVAGGVGFGLWKLYQSRRVQTRDDGRLLS